MVSLTSVLCEKVDALRNVLGNLLHEASHHVYNPTSYVKMLAV